MKKLFVAFCVLAMATGAFAAIAGSGHDFSLPAHAAWNAGGEICKPCHTPHNAVTPQLIPLWNHLTTVQVFQMYTSINNTLDEAIQAAPANCSRACLSCHDGATALDAFSGAPGGIVMGAVNANLGLDLSNDHPISIGYSSPPLDNELFEPTVQLSGLPGGGTIQDDMLFGVGQDQVECCSCHDAHNTPDVYPLLRKSNAASALCLTCHNK